MRLLPRRLGGRLALACLVAAAMIAGLEWSLRERDAVAAMRATTASAWGSEGAASLAPVVALPDYGFAAAQAEQPSQVGCAARADHQMRAFALQSDDAAQCLLVLRRREIRLRHTAPYTDQKEKVERHRAGRLGDVGDGRELVPVFLEQGGLHQNRQARLAGRLHAPARAFPRPGQPAQAVVKPGRGGVETDTHAGRAQRTHPGCAFAVQHDAVAADDRHQAQLRRASDQFRQILAHERLAAGQDQHRPRRQLRELPQHVERFPGAEFVVGLASALYGIQIAVAAVQVAQAREVPRDDKRLSAACR